MAHQEHALYSNPAQQPLERAASLVEPANTMVFLDQT